VVFAGSALCVPEIAEARTYTDKEISQVETLSALGSEACAAKKYDSCYRMFVEAEAILPWAPHKYYIGEALVGMGRMLEGIAVWQALLETEGASEDSLVKQFVETARRRLAEEEPRVPELTLDVAAVHRDQVDVHLDGKKLVVNGVTHTVRLDPGEHVLEVSQLRYERELATLRLDIGERETFRLQLRPLTQADDVVRPGTPQTEKAHSGRPASSSWKTPVGLTLGGIGVAAIVGGAVAYSLREQRNADLVSDCGGGETCRDLAPDDYRARTDRIEDRTLVMNLLLFGGGAFVAGGAGLLMWELLDGPETGAEGASARLRAGLAGADPWVTVSGAF
jgi:hypothetical protein